MHSVANCNTVSNLIFKRFCSLYNRALSSSSYLVRFVYSKLLHSLTGYNHIIYGHYNEFISSNDLFIAYFIKQIRYIYGLFSPCENISYLSCS